ncbi:MAG TPA: triose-phosphate isomerase family protein [Actinomycetota bacterium]|nr:triose-phosphate isomerase family protein [Actinomycetota bacterium]
MKYLVSNWKMYPTTDEAVTLFAEIQKGLRARACLGYSLPTCVICPPFVSLPVLKALADPELVSLGAQNCHSEPSGPFTGEISAEMLKGVAEFVLIGHSERRAAGETDEQIACKVAACAAAGLRPMLCVGEDERTDAAASQAEERLIAGISRIDPTSCPVLVVYEPTWAVGGDQPADVDYVCRLVEHLKCRMTDAGMARPEVIYGGTVTPRNAGQFAALEVLDGVGATRAGLDAGDFLALADRLTDASEL